MFQSHYKYSTKISRPDSSSPFSRLRHVALGYCIFLVSSFFSFFFFFFSLFQFLRYFGFLARSLPLALGLSSSPIYDHFLSFGIFPRRRRHDAGLLMTTVSGSTRSCALPLLSPHVRLIRSVVSSPHHTICSPPLTWSVSSACAWSTSLELHVGHCSLHHYPISRLLLLCSSYRAGSHLRHAHDSPMPPCAGRLAHAVLTSRSVSQVSYMAKRASKAGGVRSPKVAGGN